jgi:hypothetical protein
VGFPGADIGRQVRRSAAGFGRKIERISNLLTARAPNDMIGSREMNE